MTYRVHNLAGAQPIANHETTQKHPLGTIVVATDPTYGQGEFVYLLGVASTAVGSVVSWHPSTYATALCTVGGNITKPVGIAMAATVASEYGWYQISGMAVCAKTCTVSVAAGIAAGVLTTGLIAGTGSGKELQGATIAAVASAKAGGTTVIVAIQRPHKQGRVT